MAAFNRDVPMKGSITHVCGPSVLEVMADEIYSHDVASAFLV